MISKIILSASLTLIGGSSIGLFAAEDTVSTAKTQQELPREQKERLVDELRQLLRQHNIRILFPKKIIDERVLNFSAKLPQNLDPDCIVKFFNIISQMTWLKKVDVSFNNFRNIPDSLGNLFQLEGLRLGLCQYPPSSLSKLTQLKTLDIYNCPPLNVPELLANLTQLEVLYLPANDLHSLPEFLGSLHQLKKLDLSSNRIQNLPASLGNLTQLRTLNLNDNQIQSVPASLGRIQSLQTLILKRTPYLLPRGDSDQNWGREELQHHFGDRVVLDPFTIVVMPAWTKKEDVYQPLDQQTFRINRGNLQKAALPEIPVDHTLTGEEMLTYLEHIFSTLNFDDETKSNYLSYEVLANDFASDTRSEQLSNLNRVWGYLYPRLTGYIRTLYHLPLEGNDVQSWRMYEAQVQETQKTLTFMMERISKEADPDVKAIWFTQLVNGLIHCPTGQSEALNAIAYAMLEGQYHNKEAASLIDRLIAIKKNEAFTQAILAKGGDNPQNVHLLGSYRNQLKREIGLTTAIESFHERVGVLGTDPFTGNLWNVVQVFYGLVNPQRLINWVFEKTETPQDRADLEMLHRLEKLTVEQSSTAELAQKQIVQLEQKVNNPDLNDEERSQLERRLQFLRDQQMRLQKQREVPEDLASYLAKEKLTIKTALQKQKAVIQHNLQFRPLTVGNLIRFLVDEKLITPETNDWQNYVTADPTIDPDATITRDGIERILIHMGYIIHQ